MTRLRGRLGVLLGAILLSSSLHAADTPAQNLSLLLNKINSLSATFEQLVLDGSGRRLQQVYGEMVLARPGKFRWRTEEPFPQLLVSNGQTLWLYDQDLEQVTRRPVDHRLSSTPALLLSGNLDDLENTFRVQGPVEGDSGVFRLLPKNEEALFVVLRIGFAAGVPTEMQLEDNLGQKTGINFSDILLNPEVDDSQFEFQVPAGIDLITE
ncbi:MAG: outer membrane lipoprotein carrier protein [Motiliproteus sp.]|jgi:outer membrane lipoprotein carrier protein